MLHPPLAMLSPSVAELAREGVAVVVATRDSALRPCIARAWGPQIDSRAARVRVCVEAPPPSRTRANLGLGDEIALTMARPSTYRSIQLKGEVAALDEPTEGDLEAVEVHHALFAAEGAGVGLPSRLVARILDRGGLLAVTMIVEEAYDQTPGANAGGRL